eukprot:s1215_g17.t2
MLTKFAQSDTRVIFPDVALRARTAAYNSARCDVWSLPTRAWQSSVDLQHVLLQLLHVAVATWRRKYCRQQKPEMLGAACLGNLETTCRQPSPSDHRTAQKLRPWKQAYEVVEVEDDEEALWMEEDFAEVTAEVWDQELADELEQREEEQRQEEIDEVPGEAEDQPWEGEEFQEDERELGEEAVGEDSEPPPEEADSVFGEEPPLQKASFAPLSRTATIPPAMPRRAPPASSPKEPNGSVGALAASHLFKRRAADAAKKGGSRKPAEPSDPPAARGAAVRRQYLGRGSVAATASIPKANPAAKGRGSVGTATTASIPRANPSTEGRTFPGVAPPWRKTKPSAEQGSIRPSAKEPVVVKPRGFGGAVPTPSVVPPRGNRPTATSAEDLRRPLKRKASDPVPSEPKLLRERLKTHYWKRVCDVQASYGEATITAELANTELADDDVADWLAWLRGHPELKQTNLQSVSLPMLDLSNNQLSSRGIRSICAFLEEHCVRVDEMIFNHNEVDDEGLYRIAQYITSESAPVTALHFSSNQISILGVFKLLTMLSLHPMYPLETSLHGKASFIPLWLQLDNNNITDEDLQDFLDFHLRELGCAICLVGKHCSLWTCQCVKQMKMDDRKHNVALHLCLRAPDQSPPDSKVLQAGLAAAGRSAHRIFQPPRSLTCRKDWLQQSSAPGSRALRTEPKFLYEDAHFMVMLKPAGWHCSLSHKAAGLAASVKTMSTDNRKAKAANLLTQSDPPPLHDYIILRFGEVGGSGMKEVMNDSKLYGMVHRLDQGTSGPLLIAKNQIGFDFAKTKIVNQEYQRDYLALVHGTFGRDALHGHGPTGLIQAPVDRSMYEWTRRCEISENGQPASTLYERIAEYESRDRKARYTLLHCRLLTGRTHQIRVHMEYIGMPLVGDRQYWRHRQAEDPNLGCQRTFLHKVRFILWTCPSSEPVVVWSPLKYAADLCEVLKKLRRTQGYDFPEEGV